MKPGAAIPPAPAVRFLGVAEYQPTWDAMRQFTAWRKPDTRDEIWLLQHPPVYTQGQAGKPEHLLNAHDIPVVKIDRGGQINSPRPGPVGKYGLADLPRQRPHVRPLRRLLEPAVGTPAARPGLGRVG